MSVVEEGVKLHTKGRVMCAPSATIDGDVFTFKGGSTGIVKFLEPMNPLLNYFEYLIVDRGQEASIGVGVGERGYPMSRMPGWNRNSVGYHGDDGKLYHENGMGKAFGPTCTTGDRMGCGVDFDPDCGYGYVNVFFTKNGRQVGDVVRMKRPAGGIYPLVGLHSLREKVRYLGHWKRVPDGNCEPMEHDHSPSMAWLRSNGIQFLLDGYTLGYAGAGGDVQDVAMAQYRYPISRTNHFFELEILGTGTHGAVAIGLAKTTYPLHRHPGWNPGAVGYHADDGKLFKEKGYGDQFGPSCTEGDTMGCGVQFSALDDEEESDERGSSGSEEDEEEGLLQFSDNVSTNSDTDDSLPSLSDEEAFELNPYHLRPPGLRLPRHQIIRRSHMPSGQKCTVFFTKNGEKVGETECEVPKGGFYPVVAMLSCGEKLRVNFQPLSG